MSILAYVGIPGSGKSYEVVSSVILEHFKKGRRIVSNIEGVTDEKLRHYCISKGISEESLGKFISVTDEQCQSPEFFPYKGSVNTICSAGDLICLDEIWRIFPNDKINVNHRSFLAEHRHFVDTNTGVTTDLVVINQSVSGIPRFIKDRIEQTFKMSKLISLGLNNRYRVDIYQGSKTTKTNKTLQLQKKYNKEIFDLYSSYDGANASEVSVDGRGNILGSFKFKFFLVFSLILIFWGAYTLNSFFNQNEIETAPKMNEEVKKTVIKKQSLVGNNMLYPDVKPNPVISLSPIWRIAGELSRDGNHFVILIDHKGQIRFEPRSIFRFKGRMLQGEIDNFLVTYYSGGGLNE
ncbi:zonular occludens toxin domain-containing protein [Pasteurella skyensis]|uniref:Zonular occludens toxin domain-containing protein n=1 Tax=Phocoenobacter skyensis TaxID=97481 RepID=A0AAJ6NBM0_9PAST|nr:zonular occludens toxin domain-containing protein [Pasteurella skyensis]MDP8163491.1 zonular occludens toxin domain-containing protein [Pasteurella skyensis]MDP8173806.1 zonular occludens toxin domain-containing protein [Pasteurella skyensis]MDP8179955.1 zonular occludens toxin domain-containing protein [Pasteurella skyensis]MDP8182652.1 zonular occludens toxin domain-containing protein [Pasteurella skyensis]MDP8182665.1 zonular occludens toxin domain-containing protein [Pasteurella skyensi